MKTTGLLSILLGLTVLGSAPGPATAQSTTTSPPHFSPAERPALDQIPEGGIGRNFELVGHNPLVNPGHTLPRGDNENDVAVVGNCLYAAARSNSQGTAIVDISNPRQMRVVGTIEPPLPPPSSQPLSTADLSAIESLNLLVRQVWNTGAPFDGNAIEIFDTTDCVRVTKVGEIPLPDAPHEHFLWQGGDPKRVLLFVTFSSASRKDLFPAPPRDIDLRVYDLTDKRTPKGPVALWSLQRFGVPAVEPPDLLKNAGHGQVNHLHNVTVSPDGTRIYASHRHAGFYILDGTALAKNRACDPEPNIPPTADNPFGVNPHACIKKLHPDPNVRFDYHPPFTQSHTHTAVKVPNRPYVVLNDEPVGNNCPWSWVRIVNVDDGAGFDVNTTFLGVPVARAGTKYRGDLFPHQEGAFKIPETIVERCPATRARLKGANFNAHKPLVFENLVFVNWLSGGVRAIDISNPGTPFEAGFFFPKPVRETQSKKVNPEVAVRSYPVLKDGLLYVLDGHSGVYALRYTGPRKDEIPQQGLYTQNAVQVPGRAP